MSDPEPEIRIEADGPYRVSGSLPLARTHQIETEYGEPVDWAELEPLATGKRYALCRCGRSSTKPFCDDSHEELDWDSEETADRAPRSTRAQIFRGDGVVMTDDHSFCTHAGYCGDRFTNVWKMMADTADPAVRERLKHMVDLCPSGTIDHATHEGDAAEEPPFERGIAISADGPVWVRGGVRVVGADGRAYEVRNRMTLCRCGHSANKPFCDGSHQDVGFRDG